MGFLAVADVAARLGVTTRQVQHLVAGGELRAVARGVIDETSVVRYLAVRRESHQRAWSEATAWGAVALLSGRDVTWMGASQRSRLKARLRTLGAGGLVTLARGRAVVRRYSGHPSTAVRLRAELVNTARAAEVLGLSAATGADGYIGVVDVEFLVARHSLRRDDEGQYTLRATTMDLTLVSELAQTSTVLAALDLSESLDFRERRAGLDGLEAALDRQRA